MTRTHLKHLRVYADGYDISGYTRQVGALGWAFESQPDQAITDNVKNIIPGQGDITAGPINAFLDNDTGGLRTLAQSGTGTRNIMIPVGLLAAPAAGNPVFCWEFEQTSYNVEPGTGFVAANLVLGQASFASTKTYCKPWGALLHAKAAETGVNSATGIDDRGASSALGGIFAFQIFSSNGTVTVKCQHAASNVDGSFADLTGATSGSVDATTTPVADMIALSTSLSVNRYLRWQIAFGTANTVTFAAAFIRG